MPRKNRSEEKREAIIKAFGNCLKNDTIRDIGIRDIAAAADVPLGSIHYYFENKEAILFGYYEKMLSEYLELYRAWADGIPQEISTFAGFYAYFMEFVEKVYFEYEKTKPSNRYLKGYNMISEFPEVKKLFQRMTVLCGDEIARAIGRANFPCREPRKLADALMAMLDGFSLYCEVAVDGVDRMELLSTVAQALSDDETHAKSPAAPEKPSN